MDGEKILGRVLLVGAVVVIAVVVWLVNNVTFLARGCSGGYKNHFEVTEIKRDDGVEFNISGRSSSSGLFSGLKGIYHTGYTEVSSYVFKCRLDTDQKVKNFTFKIKTEDKDGKPVQFTGTKYLFVSNQAVYDYMAKNGIEGSIKSIKLVDIDFSVYRLESDAYEVWRFKFVPTHKDAFIGFMKEAKNG